MESVVYAVDWNQVRENVFAGAAWLGGAGGGGAEVIEQLRKPTALVCSARGAEKNTLIGGRKKRDDMLLDLIRSATAKGGTVLIPTDSSARVLELAYILEHAWRRESLDSNNDRSLRKARLYLASRTAGGTMRYVRSMLEWMDENVVREFESEATTNTSRQHRRGDSKQNNNNNINAGKDHGASTTSNSPFEFKFMKMVESRRRLEKILSKTGPRVILASGASLEWGFSKDTIQRIAKDPTNLIILTDETSADEKANSQKNSIADKLRQWLRESRDGVHEINSGGSILPIANNSNRDLQVNNLQRVPLEGKELLIYQQYLATRRQTQGLSQTATGATLDATADAADDASSSSSSSSDESNPERQGKALNVSARTARFNRSKIQPSKENLGVNILIRQAGIYDFDVRGKKGRDQMFPFLSRRRRVDDFGDLIKPEDYLRAEEKDDANGQDMHENGIEGKESVGHKRKWQDPRMPTEGQRNGMGPNKRRHAGRISGNGTDASLNGLGINHQDTSSEASDDEVDGDIAVPSKLHVTAASTAANFQLTSLDFSGIHDQRSLTMLIPLIQPKKLILVGGSSSETSYLADDCGQKLGLIAAGVAEKGPPSIFTPFVGQTVDASVDTNAWNVKLSETLVSGLRWQNVRGLSIVTLMGHLGAAAAPESSEQLKSQKELKLAKEEDKENQFKSFAAHTEGHAISTPQILDVLPASMAVATRSAAQPLHVGDLRLADLRKVLQSNGHTAEFRGEGTLLIDGLVAVRKSGHGTIEVESGGRDISDIRLRRVEGTFYLVKRKIYECLAVIAGG